MKILVYTGYHEQPLSKDRYINEGCGGTEYCAIILAEALVKKGHQVVLSGYVDNKIQDARQN